MDTGGPRGEYRNWTHQEDVAVTFRKEDGKYELSASKLAKALKRTIMAIKMRGLKLNKK